MKTLEEIAWCHELLVVVEGQSTCFASISYCMFILVRVWLPAFYLQTGSDNIAWKAGTPWMSFDPGVNLVELTFLTLPDTIQIQHPVTACPTSELCSLLLVSWPTELADLDDGSNNELSVYRHRRRLKKYGIDQKALATPHHFTIHSPQIYSHWGFGLCHVIKTYVYFMYYSEDTSTVKFLVAAICGYLVVVLVNLLVVSIVQCRANATSFFAHKIYYLCRPQVKWLVTAPIISSSDMVAIATISTGSLRFIDDTINVTQIRFSIVIPLAATLILSESLITVSLCILLRDSGSRSAFSGTKRLLNTLIIYAINRGLLTLLVTIVELTMSIDHRDTLAMGLDFIIGKSSLNTRQYLQSRVLGSGPNERINAVHLVKLPKLSEEREHHVHA
ncbi:hypothetical protein F5J12DRAFT_782773 [Pisolithus orientalis]|uniref:uncharacterized protein n=1 Tax=Pisolithus orientalis TaxID=936130 RepID=UPI002224CC35|nr:uncharacterized protein F5J12DRAFT_782773 [Pisolithus orientalis]KAI6006477.1 hypothetical protein F5J12DRAFT_782773 [Pisolithus orientalis]